MDWLRKRAEQLEKQVIVINLDETSIKCSWPQVQGNVVRPKLWFSKGHRPRAKASLKDMRSAITHVALVCDQPGIQALLPQIFIGNEVAFPAADMENAPQHPRVQFWRRRSSWNSVELMQRIIEEISKALSVVPGAQVILVMDAAPIHLHRAVLEHGMRHKVWLACVPAGLTWLLQPLDTHVFSPYKSYLKNQYRAKLSQGAVSKLQWLNILVSGATTFLCGRKWKRAFEADGLLALRDDLAGALKPYVAVSSPQPSGPAALSEAQLGLCLPRGRKSLHHTLWTHGPASRKRYLFVTWGTRPKRMRRQGASSQPAQ